MLSPSQCEARGCCWDPSLDTLNWCYFPSANLANVSVVHVIQGCHLDVGFIHTAPDIVNLWFDEYFPLAFEVGAELDSWANSTARLKFTAQSWLVSLYVNCPPILGLHCPNASALAQFHDAVAKGYITWHAVPFNMQPEFMDASLMAFAVELYVAATSLTTPPTFHSSIY